MLEFPVKKLRLINYFLAFITLLAILILTRDLISTSLTNGEQRRTGKENAHQPQTALIRKNLMQYAAVLEKNPFGAPGKLHQASLASSEDKGTADISLSNLILMGTAVGSGSLSYAIFEDRTQSPAQQEVFRLGSEVFQYGTLKKIERSSVSIQRNASSYTVSLSDLSMESSPAQEQSREAPKSQNSFARKVGERDYILDSRRIQKSLENPEQILTDARMLPNINAQTGKQEGFTISEVVPNGIYYSLGLRNGDILLRINDLEISNPEVAMQAMSALKGMNNINLDIIRSGQNMSMNYRIR
ncbi:MAG: hypothetical protein C4538_00290 [Nitrospiraceae bacterium]|nr:MAG: hypothetical protein C4538_00290 [Nitrospiraceae bacterium]